MARRGTDGPRTRLLGRSFSLRAHFAGLLGLFVLSAAVGTVYLRLQADSDARSAGTREARVAADGASRVIATGATVLRSALTTAVANPAADRQLLAHPAGCKLSYSPVGPFTRGHIDILRPDGSVLCSSLGAARILRGYRGAHWLAGAATQPLSLLPVTDPETGRPAALTTMPFPGGIAATFVDLRSVGLNLESQLGEPAAVRYVVTSPDRRRVLASSANPGRSVSRSPGPSRPHGTASVLPGSLAHGWLVAERRVAGLGWVVYAGYQQAAALRSADRLFYRNLVRILATLVLFVLAVIFIERRISRPIHELQIAMRAAPEGMTPAPAGAAGVTELVSLADSFGELAGRVGTELRRRTEAQEAARAAEHDARAAAEGYRLLFESNPQPMWIYDNDTLEIFEVNEAAVERYGYSREEFLSKRLEDIRPAEDLPALQQSVAAAGRTDRSGPWRHVRKDGSLIEVEIASHEVILAGRQGRLVTAMDVTDRERLQRQLAQVQRLESLGQLAGGVAHDFNNLLAVIANYAAFVGEEVASAERDEDPDRWRPVRSDIEQIQHAARRATALTHQLLAFARREVIHPEVVTLNEVVAETEQLLRRSLGEHIELRCSLADGLWPVLVDPGQIEQVLINLAVNARDAMPGGGALLVETANLVVDEAYASTRPGVAPGQYVRLRVSDNGEGMDPATLERAFEPFFTTKPSGQGTGLGLATIYGIVNQAGGRVQLYSEPGVGTTCAVLLPTTTETAYAPAEPEPEELGGAGEIVLLVEDEGAIREVARRILARNGYEVMTAAGGPAAVQIARDHTGRIDLLLTDVIMPRMMGREVVERIRDHHPETAVLFMSGYAEPILGTGELPADVLLVEKPFSEQGLLAKVRQALTTTAKAIGG